MRRADKEITDKTLIDKILIEAEVVRLAMVDEGTPYLVAMNYAYVDGCLYMHSAIEGRKINILRENNNVAFQTDTDVELVLKEEACSCSTKYLSVFGTGKATFIEDKKEKVKTLDAIMTKHTGKAGFEYPEKMLEKTLIIKVQIESVTGKKSGY
ncbi:pyridoxamine 5'-phosphate oxidase family protein [Acetivibrio cellulolyticus]|uniref:pyridoxamine 5'-phosphate oxidase family protein n=1 Tax=Acetivibrio cellulolyticus TaxID=35830 RepID=UPI0001E2DED1|nr:pyridoxamine 5'-phosphate oxidase family protein [Acetivibrio cellulolyticus]